MIRAKVLQWISPLRYPFYPDRTIKSKDIFSNFF